MSTAAPGWLPGGRLAWSPSYRAAILVRSIRKSTGRPGKGGIGRKAHDGGRRTDSIEPMADVTVDGDVLRGEPPAFGAEDAAAVAASLFGLHGTATPVGSERDQGFVIQRSRRAGRGPQDLQRERRPGGHRHGDGRGAPRVGGRPDPPRGGAAPAHRRGSGERPERVRDHGCGAGRARASRSCLCAHAGSRLDRSSGDRRARRLYEYGAIVARLGRAMRSFFHPSAGRVLLWDVHHAAAMRPMLDAIADPAHRRCSKACSIGSRRRCCRGGRRSARRSSTATSRWTTRSSTSAGASPASWTSAT